MMLSALLGLAAGAGGAGCVALYDHRRGRGIALALLLLTLLAAHAGLLLSVANSSVAANRAVVSYIEESTKLIRMQVEEKLGAGDSLDSTSHKITNPGGEENTNTDGFHPPKVDNDLMDDNDTDPTRSEEAVPPPPAAEAPPPAGWRSFSFPTSDHVLLLGCSGDEFTVRIMPRAEGREQHKLREANGDVPDRCLRPEDGTLTMYNRDPYYYALFWSLPGEENLVPAPVKAKESEVALVMEETPGSFVLNADVVAFYRPIPGPGRSEMLVRPRNALGFMPVSNVEKEGRALQPLYPHNIIYSDY